MSIRPSTYHLGLVAVFIVAFVLGYGAPLLMATPEGKGSPHATEIDLSTGGADDDALKHTLEGYFDAQDIAAPEVEYELLQQDGVRYTLWVRVRSYGRVQVAGAAQMTRGTDGGYALVRFLPVERILAAPEALRKGFPADMQPLIAERAAAE